MASFLDWVRGKNKNNSGNSLVPYQNNPTGWTAANDTGYYKQANSIAPFANTAEGLQAASQTPHYEMASYNQKQYNDSLGGGGGSGYVDPELAQKNTLKQQIRDRYNIFQDVFNGLFGAAEGKAREQTDQLNQSYDRQVKDLGDQYQNTAKQTAYMMGARGIGNSSYNQDAQETAANVYQSSLGDIGQNRQQGLGSIGSWLAGQKQALGNNRGAYDRNMQQLDQLGLQDLNNLYGQIDQATIGAQNQAPTYYTQGQNIAELSKVTPVQNTGTAQLASKLQALVTSSAPIFAKRQIAQGLVKAANLTDPGAVSYWQNQFEDLLKNNGMA